MRAALKRRRGLTAVVTLVVAIAVGAGGWWFFVRDDPDRDCAGLRTDAGVRTALGPNWRADLPCGELADGLRRAVTGDRPGVHTVEQARAMNRVLLALARRDDQHVHPAVRRPLAEAVADYAVDTHAVLTLVNDLYNHHDFHEPVWQGGDTVRMSVDQRSLIRALRGLSEDPVSYGLLRAADLRQAATAFGALPPTPTESAVEDVAGLAAFPAGAFDGIADQVVHGRSDAAKQSWWKEAITRLKAERTDPAPGFAVDPVGALVTACVDDLHPDGSPIRLLSQSLTLLNRWSTATRANLDPSALENIRLKTNLYGGTGRENAAQVLLSV
ncbi:hypothetical protein ACFRAR_33865 [Kitasatospora sp. NPDC056651]|uniref:hypothetical protein n=1 Tax=Kitasatospora sp. NPDC056651 TaxID=3345892 RepID=UPI00367710DF